MPSENDPHQKLVCDQCGGGPEAGDRVLRCECGSLLARYVGGQLELKCRRCKRTVMVPLDGSGAKSCSFG